MKIEETRLATGKQTYKLSASYGKVLQRIADGAIFGETLVLGYIYYLNGIKLDEPHWEVPTDYTETNAPSEEEEEPQEEVVEVVDTSELGTAIRNKLNALYAYDKSGAVNEFFYGNEQMWMPLEKRLGMAKAANDHEFLGLDEMTYTMDNGMPLTLPISQWKYLLATIEIYAQECYNVTASHAANIKALDTAEDVMDYDFTSGYPEKVTFNLD